MSSVLLYTTQDSDVLNITLSVTSLGIREPTQRASTRVTASK